MSLIQHAILSGAVVLCFLGVFFYLSRILGWLVSSTLSIYTWHKYKVELRIGKRIWRMCCRNGLYACALESVSLSLLGGHVLFKNVHYIGENMTLRVVHGKLSLALWRQRLKAPCLPLAATYEGPPALPSEGRSCARHAEAQRTRECVQGRVWRRWRPCWPLTCTAWRCTFTTTRRRTTGWRRCTRMVSLCHRSVMMRVVCMGASVRA